MGDEDIMSLARDRLLFKIAHSIMFLKAWPEQHRRLKERPGTS
jgi:hypothetical protein